jgi:lipoate-protein ligase A
MYAVLLSLQLHPHLRAIDAAHQFVLDRLVAALRKRLPGIARQGTSDLTLADSTLGRCKFSGNSLRVKREHVLYHGTLLYDFSLELIGQCLAAPPRQPEYRQARVHERFVANLPLSAAELRAALSEAWSARQPLVDWPRELTRQLAEEKYLSDQWNRSR